MTGARLEIRANVVSGLVPHITNLQKSAEMAKVEAVSVVRRFWRQLNPFLRKVSVKMALR